MSAIHTLLRENRGAGALEYSLVAGIVMLGIVSVLGTTRMELRAELSCVASRIAGDGGAGGCRATTPAPDDAAFAAPQAQLPSGYKITGVLSGLGGTGVQAIRPADGPLYFLYDGSTRLTNERGLMVRFQYADGLPATELDAVRLFNRSTSTVDPIWASDGASGLYAISTDGQTYGVYVVERPSN
ncbi:hypothetical protein [uncultured Methylobacterium sp.]|uniref:Flp family type IVb pilin n=1 Tax=uncultured Methylobacterium sp. TaxID=157278 RepID=UPI0025918263|nr:hypothetical protein [uncultured Methylobacterium sp.]